MNDPSETVNEASVAAVLAGDASYDDLKDAEQAAVRAVWDERISARRAGLDLVREFRMAWRGGAGSRQMPTAMCFTGRDSAERLTAEG